MREYLKESDFADAMKKTVEPHLALRRHTFTVPGYDGAPLFAVRYDADRPRGTVLLLHGFGESAEKYRELTYYLLREGHCVLLYDQRGHGRSPRTADASVTHIRRFEEYLGDGECILRAALSNCPAPYDLFAHSMGGAVGALLLEEHPWLFRRAVLSSPMIAVKHGKAPRLACVATCAFCALTGRGAKRIFAVSPRAAKRIAADAALSRTRYMYYETIRRDDPRLVGGAPTYRWSLESLKVTRKILKKNAPECIQTAVRIYSADLDHLVKRAAQRDFAARLPHGEFLTVPTRHEIYNAEDVMLFPYLDGVLDFFSPDA